MADHEHHGYEHHGHDHSHSHLRAGARHLPRLWLAFACVASVLLVEVAVGLATGSLALLSDAGHMAADVGGLAMSLAAIHLANRGSRRSGRSFGLYRLEVLAALGNAVLLIGVAGYVVWEAGTRVGDGHQLDVGPVLFAALLGLAANVVAFVLLRPAAAESMNVEGAYLEVLADLVGSIGVVIAAVVTGLTDWEWVDPAVGAALGLWILPRTWRLAMRALRILVQAAPAAVDLDALVATLAGIPGVVDVHDVHVWTLTSDMDVATAHLMVRNGTDHHGVLDEARHLLADEYGLVHATLQVEPEDHLGCDDVSW